MYVMLSSTTTPTKSGMLLKFMAQPTAGTYTVEPNGPSTAMGVQVQTAHEIGNASSAYVADSGTVTVTLSGGKLSASYSALPSTIPTGAPGAGMTGVAGGSMTCP